MNGTTSNGYYKHPNGYGNQNKADDNGMMEIILKNPANENKMSNGHGGSNSNIPTAAGGLPGVRGRTRQSISGGKASFLYFFLLFLNYVYFNTFNRIMFF